MTHFPLMLGQLVESAAHPEPVQEVSFLAWMFQSLGIFYGVTLPLFGLLIFLGACLTVFLSRRPSVIAAYLVFVPIPVFLGVFGSIQGLISSLSVIAYSASPSPSELSVGISTALFTSYVGILVTVPSYFVVSLGLFIRAILAPSEVKR